MGRAQFSVYKTDAAIWLHEQYKASSTSHGPVVRAITVVVARGQDGWWK